LKGRPVGKNALPVSSLVLFTLRDIFLYHKLYAVLKYYSEYHMIDLLFATMMIIAKSMLTASGSPSKPSL